MKPAKNSIKPASNNNVTGGFYSALLQPVINCMSTDLDVN